MSVPCGWIPYEGRRSEFVRGLKLRFLRPRCFPKIEGCADLKPAVFLYQEQPFSVVPFAVIQA